MSMHVYALPAFDAARLRKGCICLGGSWWLAADAAENLKYRDVAANVGAAAAEGGCWTPADAISAAAVHGIMVPPVQLHIPQLLLCMGPAMAPNRTSLYPRWGAEGEGTVAAIRPTGIGTEMWVSPYPRRRPTWGWVTLSCEWSVATRAKSRPDCRTCLPLSAR